LTQKNGSGFHQGVATDMLRPYTPKLKKKIGSKKLLERFQFQGVFGGDVGI